jgi:hypothetical protein
MKIYRRKNKIGLATTPSAPALARMVSTPSDATIRKFVSKKHITTRGEATTSPLFSVARYTCSVFSSAFGDRGVLTEALKSGSQTTALS